MTPTIWTTIIGYLSTGFYAVMGWFTQVTNATFSLPVILGVIVAMLAIRFIVYPALKPSVGSSDQVKKKTKGKKKE